LSPKTPEPPAVYPVESAQKLEELLYNNGNYSENAA